ncbi:hypothetical protein PHYSODRAFT_471752 [Phytophthora sojae]|uniref:Retroviral polymerase SH3-like domain-containing protein n=1 Tax=Phytophthora sojae (strain P6497) TaxID=1094619 RepID=G4YJH9_PHYSP|nr:hypothetical protein PHYSODRAFT_471752 [Phytophthora sojae]EGZ29934.1 hypothetical protein PHYSODRAFT_471752 [Phytophthora sojae]|eukprot:XP_009517209.1 hypothetical protein PHYSODRAFT_471752 [Phytophthora sojae]
MHVVVLSRVRSLLTTVNRPNLLWGEAFRFAEEVLNISRSAALGGESPYTRRFGERPDLSSLRTKNKLDNPGQPGLFLAYGKESIIYRVLDLKTGKMKELRPVEFAENWTVGYSYVGKLLLE